MANDSAPRPKNKGLYSAGPYDWYWDGDVWTCVSPAAGFMPAHPDRDELHLVIRTYRKLTDDDFQ